MKKILFYTTVLLMALSCCSVTAQGVVDVGKWEESRYYFLSSATGAWHISEKNTLREAMVHPEQFSAVSSSRVIKLKTQSRYIWLKNSFCNKATEPVSFSLVIASSLVYEGVAYVVSNGRLKDSVCLGNVHLFSTTRPPGIMNKTVVSVQPGENAQVYTQLMIGNKSLLFYTAAFRENQIQYLQHRMYLLTGIFTGILWVVILFNLFLFWFIKDRIHFWYALSACSNWMLMLSLNNLDVQYIYPEFPFLSYINRVFYTCTSVFLTMKVAAIFLSVKRTNSRFISLLHVLRYAMLAFSILYIVTEWLNAPAWIMPYRMPFFTSIMVLSILSVLSVVIEKIGQGVKYAVFYLFAIVTLCVAGILNALVLNGIIGYFPLPPGHLAFGIVVETIVIAFGILYRYNLFKKENDGLKIKLEEEKRRVVEQILKTQEEEQSRIARDLHDELGGNLAALKMTLQRMNMTSPDKLLLEKLADEAAGNARSISHNLMPPDFEETPLVKILDNYFSKINTEGMIRFRFHCDFIETGLHKNEDLMLYRIVLELVNNIIRHSKATEANVQLLKYDDQFSLMAEDNGVGFQPAIAEGSGLKNIRSRVAFLNGKLSIDAGPNGTTTIIQIPK